MTQPDLKLLQHAEESFQRMARSTGGRFDLAHTFIKNLDPTDPGARAAVSRIMYSKDPGATLLVEAVKLGWKDVMQ